MFKAKRLTSIIYLKLEPNAYACVLAAVRLSRGDHSHGVVQIMEDNWSVLCGEGFTNTEAKVVCKQLGFQVSGVWAQNLNRHNL